MHEPPTESSAPGNASMRYTCSNCEYNLVGVRIGDPCPECGTRVAQFGMSPRQSSGQAIASMVLGIVSLVTCFAYGVIGMPCAIIAVVLAKKARLAIQAGTAPISARGMADAGRVCGWIGVALNGIMLLILVAYLVLLIIALVAGVAGAGAAGGGGFGP